MKASVFIAVFIFLSVSLFAQSPSISGTVLDQETGEPLVGARVKHLSSGQEAITDFDGQFSFSESISGTNQLSVSYVSYHEAKLNRVIVKEGEPRELTIKMKRAESNSSSRPAFALQHSDTSNS